MQLKKVLEELEVSQALLSKLTGIAETHISSFCTGAKVPNSLTLARIANALGCSADALLGRQTGPASVLAAVPSTMLLMEVARRMSSGGTDDG